MNRIARIGFGAALAGGSCLVARELWDRSREDSLIGEVALITGGSRGLGLALARELAREGCRIAIAARDEGEMDRAVNDLKKRGAQVFSFRCDVSQEADVARMISSVKDHYGRIDILINNAGIIEVGPIESMRIPDFELAMNTMFWGTVYPTMQVVPDFAQRGNGRIVNVSSIGGKFGVPHLAPYVSAKFAIAGFSQALAAELRPCGVQVTAIFPGLMRTGSFSQALFKGEQVKEAQWFTLGATLPGASMSARRAARQIVTAIKRRRSQQVLSLPAKLAAALTSNFPEGTTSLLSTASALLLPRSSSKSDAKSGRDLWTKLSPIVRAASHLGISAMREFNQRAQKIPT